MLAASRGFLVFGKLPVEAKEPWLHLGDGDGLVQPPRACQPPRPLGQPAETQPWGQTARFQNMGSAAATAQPIGGVSLLNPPGMSG